MMKYVALVLAALIATSSLLPSDVQGEGTFVIKDVTYYDYELKGEVIVPQGEYYVRITLFLEGDRYIVLTDKIQDHQFCVHVAANCEYVAVMIVDRLNAFSPGTFTSYASYGMEQK